MKKTKAKTTKVNVTKVKITSSGNNLEGYLEIPDFPPPLPAVLLCHPHPLHGGNMDNNVITGIGKILTSKGFVVLRFNYRGVGKSEGAYGDGIGETDDACAAFSFLLEQKEVDAQRAGILGYSYGGMIAFAAGAKEDKIKAVVGVSPALTETSLIECVKPKFIITGENDDLFRASSIQKSIEKANEPFETKTMLRIIDDANHFWHGLEKEAGELAAIFLTHELF